MKLIAGEAKIFGAKLSTDAKVIVRKGRRMPVEIMSGSIIEITSENPGEITEVFGSIIPPSWIDAANKVLACTQRCRTVVLGDADSGKTSFCTFLANIATSHGRRVGIIDADIGQADIGPPTTIGLGLIADPVFDLFTIEAKEIFFVGAISPRYVEKVVGDGVLYLIKKSEDLDADLLVINTDGWIQDEEAKQYKIRLLKRISPEIIISIQFGDELKPILDAFNNADSTILYLDAPSNLIKRTKNERRELRKQGYRKYLKEAKIRVLSLKETAIECAQAAMAKTVKLENSKLEQILNSKILYSEEHADYVLLVSTNYDSIIEEKKRELENTLGKPIQITDERGIIAALFNKDNSFLGLGIIQNIDFYKQKIRLFTPCKGKISLIRLGCIKITAQGEELGIAP
jgi:polynucleotide 5'-hydroxyl-kinase GRC3/NOL9